MERRSKWKQGEKKPAKLVPRAPCGKYNHNLFVRIANKCLQLMKKNGEVAPQPNKYDPRMDTASYSDSETLMPREGSQVAWSSAWADMIYAFGSVSDTNDEFIEVFGKGCNGIQHRARKLIASGHFDLAKIQVASVAIKANNNDAIIAICIQSVPSMKKEPNWVTAVFDMDTKAFVCPPHNLVPFGITTCTCSNLLTISRLPITFPLFSAAVPQIHSPPAHVYEHSALAAEEGDLLLITLLILPSLCVQSFAM